MTATIPDAPTRSPAPRVPAAHPPDTADLDGFYVWLGPTAAAGHIDGKWDSAVGGSLTVMQVHEDGPLSAIGGSLGASRWTERDRGRIWVDALVGTKLLGPMIGATIGPILELAELAHPRIGASIGVWGFAGITPFVRVGVVQDLGAFVEVGVHLALPVFRR